MHQNLNLWHLEIVATVARTGGLSSAARALGVSQPTLTKMIGRMEASLGYALFERGPSGSHPTAAGKLLAEGAARILEESSQLFRRAEHIVYGESGRLELGVGPLARLILLPDLITDLGARFPNLQISINQKSVTVMMDDVRAGRLDVVMANSHYASNYGELIRTKLFEDRLLAVARPDHPLMRMAPVHPSSLLDYPFALPAITATVTKWLGEPPPERLKSIASLVTGEYDVIKQRIEHSDDIALAPEFVVADEIKSGKIAEIRTTVQPGPYDVWMLVRPECSDLPVVQAIRKFAQRKFSR